MAFVVYPWADLDVGQVVIVPNKTTDQAKAAKWHALRRASCRGKQFKITPAFWDRRWIGVRIRRVK